MRFVVSEWTAVGKCSTLQSAGWMIQTWPWHKDSKADPVQHVNFILLLVQVKDDALHCGGLRKPVLYVYLLVCLYFAADVSPYCE